MLLCSNFQSRHINPPIICTRHGIGIVCCVLISIECRLEFMICTNQHKTIAYIIGLNICINDCFQWANGKCNSAWRLRSLARWCTISMRIFTLPKCIQTYNTNPMVLFRFLFYFQLNCCFYFLKRILLAVFCYK